MIDYEQIRPDIIAALTRYAEERIPTGRFLQAVLENDLSGALARADADNLAAIHSIVGYVYNELPSPCWGSPAAVHAWTIDQCPQCGGATLIHDLRKSKVCPVCAEKFNAELNQNMLDVTAAALADGALDE